MIISVGEVWSDTVLLVFLYPSLYTESNFTTLLQVSHVIYAHWRLDDGSSRNGRNMFAQPGCWELFKMSEWCWWLVRLLFMVVEFEQLSFHNISVILSLCFDIFGRVFAILTFSFDNGRSTIEKGWLISSRPAMKGRLFFVSSQAWYW